MPARKPNAGFLKKAPSPTHEAVAEYVTKTTGHAVSAGDVALIQRLYPLYLKSDEVVKAREEEERRKAEEQAAKEREKQERLKARLAKIEEQRQRVLRELGIETDDETTPPLSVVPATVEEPDEEEPTVLVLGDGEETSDEFVETVSDDDATDESTDEDPDDWGDLDSGEEDF